MLNCLLYILLNLELEALMCVCDIYVLIFRE